MRRKRWITLTTLTGVLLALQTFQATMTVESASRTYTGSVAGGGSDIYAAVEQSAVNKVVKEAKPDHSSRSMVSIRWTADGRT